MGRLLQWCPRCETATGNKYCLRCDNLVCAECGTVCKECREEQEAEDAEG